MKLDVATLEAILRAESQISELLPPSATENCDTIRKHVWEMTNLKAAELCRWIIGLRHAARVLRSFEIDLPTS